MYDTVHTITPLLSDSPLSQNPSLTQKNSTALLVQWSPPYLWPGYSIHFYNISIQNRDNDHVFYHQINAEFDDKIVDFTFIQEQQNNCSEFTFGISAISTDSRELSTAYVTGGFASGNSSVNEIVPMCIDYLAHFLLGQIYKVLT